MYDAITRGVSRQKDVTLAVVDEEWIAQQKAACAQHCVAAGVPGISTNDVLTSYFFCLIDASHGTVACDCRGRVPGVPDAATTFKPGNYISSIPCSPVEYADPLALHQKITTTLKRASQPSTLVGVQPSEMPMPRIGNVTNWSTLYQHLELPGCQTLVHFPIVNSIADVTHGNLYLFRSRPRELAALIFTPVAQQRAQADLVTRNMIFGEKSNNGVQRGTVEGHERPFIRMHF